jgi:hypothetical protein
MGWTRAYKSNAQAKVSAEPPTPQGRCERLRQCQLLKQSRSLWMAKTEIHPDPSSSLTPRQCRHGAIGNLIVREVADGEICCGCAGPDNLEQPQIAE